MKTNSNKKVLEILVAEILLQTGFEKCTDHSIDLLTEISIFYIESLIKNTKPFMNADPLIICKFLIENAYTDEEYQIKELLHFLDQQKNLVGERNEADAPESLLHALNCLPNIKSIAGNVKSNKIMGLEEKRTAEVFHEVKMDDFMMKFIEKCSKAPANRVVESFGFDCLKIIKNTNDQKITDFKIDNISYSKSNIFGYKDEIIAEQELFVEDFKGNNLFEYV